MKFAPSFPDDVFYNVQEILKRDNLEPAVIALANRLVTEGAEDDSPAGLGIMAQASWRAGNPAQAAKHQQKMMDDVVQMIRRRYAADPSLKELSDIEVFIAATDGPEFVARLAVYEADAGNHARAKELLPHFEKGTDPFSVLARQRLAPKPE